MQQNYCNWSGIKEAPRLLTSNFLLKIGSICFLIRCEVRPQLGSHSHQCFLVNRAFRRANTRLLFPCASHITWICTCRCRVQIWNVRHDMYSSIHWPQKPGSSNPQTDLELESHRKHVSSQTGCNNVLMQPECSHTLKIIIRHTYSWNCVHSFFTAVSDAQFTLPVLPQ